MRRPRKKPRTALLVCALVAALPICAEEATVGELEGLVQQWVNLRRQLAAEKRDGSEQRRRLEDEIRLLSEEKAALEAEISETDATASELEQGRVVLLAREETMRRVLDDLLPLVERAEADLRKWRTRVPPSLGEGLRQALDKLPAPDARTGRTSLTRRLQVVVAAYTEIENIQAGVHAVREVLSLPGRKARELDVLYLGLARGFAVGPDDTWAAVGAPGPDGWTWSLRPGLAPQVRTAVTVFNRRSPASFVTLPLKVRDSGPEAGP